MSPDERIAKCASAQHGAFTIGQARCAELTDHAITHRRRTGRWRTLHRGVYAIAGAPASDEQRVMAVVLAYGASATAASVTAAWLLGLIERAPEVTTVILGAGQHRKPIRRTRLNQTDLTRADVRTVNGIRCTAPERTIVDVAGVVTKTVLEDIVDDAVQIGLTTIAKLKRYVSDGSDIVRGPRR